MVNASHLHGVMPECLCRASVSLQPMNSRLHGNDKNLPSCKRGVVGVLSFKPQPNLIYPVHFSHPQIMFLQFHIMLSIFTLFWHSI